MTLDERNDEINKALEARFSQINSAIEAHEAKLKGMMVPRDVWVMYASCEDFDYQYQAAAGEYQSYIGLIKQKGAWRLCYANHYESYSGGYPDEDLDWKPLVESSIEDRLKAAPHLDKLREAIVNSKEKLVPELEKAISTLAKSLDNY
jgi:hypothetical protein